MGTDLKSVPHFNAALLDLSSSLGGAERDRTADPLLAKQVLSQLSYSPNLDRPLQSTAGRQVVQSAHARFSFIQFAFPPRQFSQQPRPT